MSIKRLLLLPVFMSLTALTACAGKDFVQVHVSAIVPQETPQPPASLPPSQEPPVPGLIEYDPNGHPKDGIYKVYDRSGRLLLERHYQHGYRDGPQNYYDEDSGEVASHYLYDQGQIKNFIEYYPNGIPRMECELISEGTWRMRTYDPNGNLIDETLAISDS